LRASAELGSHFWLAAASNDTARSAFLWPSLRWHLPLVFFYFLLELKHVDSHCRRSAKPLRSVLDGKGGNLGYHEGPSTPHRQRLIACK
jgi:hypothetical protein